MHFKSVPFDLYIRLSDQKFVKRIHAHEEISQDILNPLEDKGIQELFCEKKYNRDFSMMLINNMINKVDRPYDNLKDQLQAHDEVFSTTKEIIQNLGLSGRVIEVCETTIEKMCLDVLSDPDEFSSYLLAMKNDRNLAFHFKIVSLTNYLGTQLISEMKLPNMDEQVKKFVFASYFCDMTLRNPAFHYHRKAEDSDALNLEEQNEVNFHALKASELVSTYKETPKEVGLIIRQHHGSFSGIGFPMDKSSQLLPLSKILIVSQELAFSILTNIDTPVFEVLRGFLKKHKSSGLSELLNVLEGSFGENIDETV
jgi:response regulator RpfG family c-di-GMP phosphodiesterase